MHEDEWLSSTDAAWMLNVARFGSLRRLDGSSIEWRPSDRKLRLLACGLARQVHGLFTDERSCDAVETADRFADGLASSNELAAIRDASWLFLCDVPHGNEPWAVASACAHWDAYSAAYDCVAVLSHGGHLAPARQADVLRDVMGNPFGAQPHLHRDKAGNLRLVSGATSCVHRFCSWLTATVKRIAEQAYEGHDWAALLVLADALEEAGCDSAELLAHCQSSGPHVRGCWALDVVLGKE
jgi:hypothetical protein